MPAGRFGSTAADRAAAGTTPAKESPPQKRARGPGAPAAGGGLQDGTAASGTALPDIFRKAAADIGPDIQTCERNPLNIRRLVHWTSIPGPDPCQLPTGTMRIAEEEQMAKFNPHN